MAGNGVTLVTKGTRMHYVKLWSNLLKSSVLEQDLHVRWFWIALLLEADQYGNVYGTPEALARIANVPIGQATQALQVLMAPDPNSTTGDEDGRRILNPEPNLWYIVNYQKYRGIKDIAEERRKTADRVRKHRQKKVTDVTPDVTDGNAIVVGSTYKVEAESSKTTTSARKARSKVAYSEDFETFWRVYPRPTNKGEAWKAWQKIAEPVPSLHDLLAAVSRAGQSRQWVKDGGQFIPYPATWINARGWEDGGHPAPALPAPVPTGCVYCHCEIPEGEQVCGPCKEKYEGGTP